MLLNILDDFVLDELTTAVPPGMPAQVLAIEPTGSETHVVARFANHDIVLSPRERLATEPGDDIFISTRPTAIHLFDTATGQRVRH